MPDFIETNAPPPVYVTGEDFTNEAKRGSYDWGDQEYINIYKPDNRMEVSHVPVADMEYALGEGYLLESKPEQVLREQVQSEEGQSFMELAGFSTSEFIDGFTMDATTIYNKYNDTPFEAARRDAYNDENKWLGRATYGMGMVLSALITGGTSAAIGKSAVVGAKAGMAAAKNVVAGRLTAIAPKATKEAVEEMAESYVKKLSTAIAEGAVVGAVDMAPAAISEAMWGDLGRAGEFVGMGGVVGGGLGGVFKVGSSLYRAGAKQGPDALMSGLSKATGVPVKAIEYFNTRQGLVNKIKPLDEFMPGVDEAFNKHADGLALSKENQKLATNELDEARRAMDKDMKVQSKEVHPLMADEMGKDLDIAQKKFNDLTEAAEENLAANIPGKIVDVSHIAKKMDNDILEYKGGGVEDRATFSKLKMLRKTITKDGLLTGMGTRKFIKSMRRDVEYKGKFATRDKVYERLVKGYAADARVTLKEVPGAEEYSKVMAFLAPRLDDLGAFKKSLSSEASRLNMASILSKPVLTGTEHTKRKAFTEFMDGMGNLEKYTEMGSAQSNAHQYLGDFAKRGKSKDLASREQFDSDHFEELAFNKASADEATQTLSSADKIMSPAIGGSKSLTPDKMAKIFMGDDTRAKEALDTFIERSGLDRDTIEASVMSEQFSKGKTSGYRYLNPRILMGGLMGGYHGVVASMALDTYGGTVLKQALIKKQQLFGHMQPTLSAISTRSKNITKAITSKIPGKASHRLSRLALVTYRSAIDDVPKEERDSIGISKTSPTIDTVNDVKYQQDTWKALTHTFEKYENNPEKLMQVVADKVSVVGSDPEVAAAAAEHIMRATSYLAQEIPKDPTTPDVFASPSDRWVPSDMDLDIYTQKVMAVQDPLSIVDAIADGSITKDMTEAVAATSPRIMEMLQGQVMGAIAKDPSKFDYDTRLSAGYLLDMPLERTATPKAYTFFQSSFATTMEEQSEEGGKGGFAPRLGNKASNTWMSKSTKISNDVYT